MTMPVMACLLAAASAAAAAPARLVAVIELRVQIAAGEHEPEPIEDLARLGYFTDEVRSAAAKVPGIGVVTRALTEAQSGATAVEVARKLGADLVLSGELRKRAGTYALDLQLYEVRSGELQAEVKGQGATQEELESAIAKAVDALLAPAPAKIAEQAPPPAAPPPTAAPPPVAFQELPPAQSAPAPARRRTWTWVAAGAAVATAGAGGFFGVKSRSTGSTISDGAHSRAELDSLRSSYTSQAQTANALFAVGAGLLAVSAALFVLEF